MQFQKFRHIWPKNILALFRYIDLRIQGRKKSERNTYLGGRIHFYKERFFLRSTFSVYYESENSIFLGIKRPEGRLNEGSAGKLVFFLRFYLSLSRLEGERSRTRQQ